MVCVWGGGGIQYKGCDLPACCIETSLNAEGALHSACSSLSDQWFWSWVSVFISLQIRPNDSVFEFVFHVMVRFVIFLFGNTSFVHTRAVFKWSGCFFHIQFPLSDIAPLHQVYSYLIWRRCDHTAALNCHLYLERLHFIPVWPLHPSHSVISHPHFLQPRMSEIPHAFQCLHSRETWWFTISPSKGLGTHPSLFFVILLTSTKKMSCSFSFFSSYYIPDLQEDLRQWWHAWASALCVCFSDRGNVFFCTLKYCRTLI